VIRLGLRNPRKKESRDLKLKFIFIRKAKAEEEKVKYTHRFKNWIFVIQQR